MKIEWKIILLSLCVSFVFMGVVTYASTYQQKTIYVYQVGIYKEEENKDAKLAELKEAGIEGYCYQKDDQYYVISMMTEDKSEIEKHATQVKGIIKTYQINNKVTNEQLLEMLSQGENND